jgi:hypothetical protein
MTNSLDKPRLLGRTSGSTSGTAWATKMKDGDGPEPERVDKDFEARLAINARSLNEWIVTRNNLEKEIRELLPRLRFRVERMAERRAEGRRPSPHPARAMGRSLKRKRKKLEEAKAEVGRLRSERGSA